MDVLTEEWIGKTLCQVVPKKQNAVMVFWNNHLGVEDDYRIVVFQGSESLESGRPLKSHLTFVDGPCRPSDRFLRLQFQRCLAVCVFGSDPREDYRDQEIDHFMEEFGVYDNEIDTTDSRWETRTPLGKEVRSCQAKLCFSTYIMILVAYTRTTSRTWRKHNKNLVLQPPRNSSRSPTNSFRMVSVG